MHCVAAEPYATFLRIDVIDGTRAVAYETAVLGRLRGGYRVFRLRSLLGTRIELAHLFVFVTFATELNLWQTSRQVCMLPKPRILQSTVCTCNGLEVHRLSNCFCRAVQLRMKLQRKSTLRQSAGESMQEYFP